MHILVVDDDRAVRDSLRRSLEFNGYTVELAADGQRALDVVAGQRPDAMVLDVMMPRLDGLEVCRRLRGAGDDLPILVLTARDAVSDRVSGLDAGADDYLPKPFALEELLARLRALLRRRGPGDNGLPSTLRFTDLELDLGTREVRRGSRSISLTRTEFSLLELLMRHPRQVLADGHAGRRRPDRTRRTGRRRSLRHRQAAHRLGDHPAPDPYPGEEGRNGSRGA